MFGRIVLKPDLARAPIYDNVYNIEGRWQSFICLNCGNSVSIDIQQYIGKSADPDTVLGEENCGLVREHFGLLSRSLENGWPKVRLETCAKCNAMYLIYVAEYEPRNGWCKGVLQGITELVPSNNALN